MSGSLRWMAIAAAGLVAVAGCGGTGTATAKVNGKVTVAGQPMEGITVTFYPTGGGRPAVGITDSSGAFTLSTLASGDGAVPGSHQVTFTKVESSEPPPSDAPPMQNVPQPFNAKYSAAQSSGITAEVATGKTNEFTWDLEK
ncbi:MAG: carboxypeptidase-like regulatory domain-containing protein [Pirellulaceae bacterium]|jgi:hypothetical protein|nr:carboxypeptidase-like regulatory domain-containing protein [Pirellulaceae bacterium]